MASVSNPFKGFWKQKPGSCQGAESDVCRGPGADRVSVAMFGFGRGGFLRFMFTNTGLPSECRMRVQNSFHVRTPEDCMRFASAWAGRTEGPPCALLSQVVASRGKSVGSH